MRSKTALINETKEPVLIVEQDINTLEEDCNSAKYTIKDTSLFFESAAKELDYVLTLYYPNEE